jgi:uncharacterized membrane-anchored protein
VDRRTKELVKRLEPGEVAIIDHRDLDRVAADALVEAGAIAVVNASRSISGRYPNGGPIRVVRAGIPLLDDVGKEVMAAVSEGDLVEIDGGTVRARGEVVGTGTVLDGPGIETAMEEARSRIGVELERFAQNTLEYVRQEAQLTFEPLELPPLHVDFRGRHALVVVRGHDYREDLRHLKGYIREHRPVLIGVDGGADALLEMGLRPDLIIGDFDSVSERALGLGADLIHHVHPDGRAPGRENLTGWGVPYEEFVVEGTSEDAAMLLAYEAGARLIVAVGTHATMVEFLDKGRAGMSSTFLTRLRLGPVLVDAKGVSQLYEGRVRTRDLVLLIGAAVAAMFVVGLTSDPVQTFFEALWLYLRKLWLSITG